MLESVAARMTGVLADNSAALSRLGLLIEPLPASVATLARVVRIDRVVRVETLPHSGGLCSHSLLFNWTAPDGAASPLHAEALIPQADVAALQDWTRPLTQGQSVVTMRGSAHEAVRRFMSDLGVLTSLMVPIMVEGRHWGRICFDDCESEHDWADDDIKLLSMLAQVIGAGITRERFRRQAQQREQLLQAVTTCAAQIGTAPDLRQAITNSLSILAQAVDVDRMLLMEVCAAGTATRACRAHC